MKMHNIFTMLGLALLIHDTQAYETMKTETVDRISGNTLEITNRFGATPIYFLPNGQFQQRGAEGKIASGIWRLLDNQLCVTMRIEPEGQLANEFCMSVADRQVGDQWTSDDRHNGVIRFRLVKGRSF